MSWVKVNEEAKIVTVSDDVSLDTLTRIVDKYCDNYEIYIADEFDENTDIEG